MRQLYTLCIYLIKPILLLASQFSTKVKHFIVVRQNWKSELIESLKTLNNKNRIWFHCSSLGEYEQAKPLIVELEKKFQIIVSFFSQSGYQQVIKQKHNYSILYLPIDTPNNAKFWLKTINPVKCIFIKNEIWPNYIHQINKKGIPLILLSGIFNQNQIYFKPYGGFLRKALAKFDTIFVQDNRSFNLLDSLRIKSIITGDTRYDNVLEMAKNSIIPPELIALKDKTVVVLGSSWQAEEHLWLQYIHKNKPELWTIIVPHDVSEKHINSIQGMYKNYNPTLFSSIHKADLSQNRGVVIVNKIGLLRQIYKLANISFVGGAFGAGLHNILEPLAQGSPVLFGSNINKFPEANETINKGIGKKVNTIFDIEICLSQWINNKEIQNKTKQYIQEKSGALEKVMKII